MTGRRTLNVGLGLCAVLAVVDIIGLVGLAMPDDAPPAVVMVVAAILGALTLAALRPAHAGRRGGMATVVSSRVLSALWGVPVYFAPNAPGWAEVATAVFIALTAVALGLLRAAQREEAYARAGAGGR
jgi:ABC-type Na+ efflux pump permease subunit